MRAVQVGDMHSSAHTTSLKKLSPKVAVSIFLRDRCCVVFFYRKACKNLMSTRYNSEFNWKDWYMMRFGGQQKMAMYYFCRWKDMAQSSALTDERCHRICHLPVWARRDKTPFISVSQEFLSPIWSKKALTASGAHKSAQFCSTRASPTVRPHPLFNGKTWSRAGAISRDEPVFLSRDFFIAKTFSNTTIFREETYFGWQCLCK